jgi:hypothetical protein
MQEHRIRPSEPRQTCHNTLAFNAGPRQSSKDGNIMEYQRYQNYSKLGSGQVKTEATISTTPRQMLWHGCDHLHPTSNPSHYMRNDWSLDQLEWNYMILCSWHLKAVETSVYTANRNIVSTAWHKAQRAIQSTPGKKNTHVQSRTKPPTIRVQKSLVSCLSCMKCNANRWITQPEGSGLQMFKVTSLDSRRTWIPRCRRPCALERTKTTWNDLVLYWGLRSSHAETQDSSRRELAQLDGWFC